MPTLARPTRIDVGVLRREASAFEEELRSLKQRLNPAPGFWYPYGTLANLMHLDDVLQGENRYLLDLAEGRPVADVGAADGDLAYFLEQRYGMDVHIVDHAGTNFNSLRGARLLKEGLSSRVEIHDIDLDQLHQLPEASYGLVLFLGLLYHLKNPFHALESLARVAKHCVLSTRVARYAPDRRTNIAELAVAYLLHESECNNDSTNYWIFSPAGLERLFRRTGWDVVQVRTFGETRTSDPASQDHDERAVCLLRSRFASRPSPRG